MKRGVGVNVMLELVKIMLEFVNCTQVPHDSVQ
jgi:hypothetical protein